MVELEAIGTVRNSFDKSTDPGEIRSQESVIVMGPEYEEGLYRLEESEYVQVLFNFHLSGDYDLKGPVWDGQVKGVFASRSPRRPSGIGLTTAELVEINGRELRVKGLDALNGSPVLDIKPYVPFLDEAGQARVREEHKKANPRSEIDWLIRKAKTKELLLRAGVLHGHFCPGLALGVIAGYYSVKELGARSQGMEKLIAVVETNSCFSDGIQFVTGCTFGNNALVYRDFGKTAVTVARRDGTGMRLSLRPDAHKHWDGKHPESKPLFQKVVARREGDEEDMRKLMKLFGKISFEILDLDIGSLFNVEPVEIEIPDYAPIHDSEICSKCGESVMASRIVEKDGRVYCLPCSRVEYFQLDGSGMELTGSR